MTPEQWGELTAIFGDALARPSEERERFVRARASSEAIATECLALLAREHALGGFLEPEAPRGSRDEQLPAETRVGAYTIVSEIGRGGMGVVYLAEQENPRRRVALKVLRAQVFSRDAARRFAHEAQMLARLEHPGIARIFEAGAEASALATRPWFTMELVEGLSLDEYCAANDLAVRARLALFVQVCEAVQHAHARGVIHRDLKPANILVSAQGEAKVLDFGVARAVDPDLRLSTLHTDPGLLIGTLAYMSPEQALGDAEAIDQRSDVYALGVILYELLARRLPHALEAISVPAAVRALIEDEPERLSSIDKRLRGDLETIVGKALEKDRARRYASAAELAADLERHLSDRPIVARPASTIYQIRKFARRNKVLVSGILAVIVVLALGVVATTRQALIAGEKGALAERESQRARGILDFLKKMLASIDPDVAQGRDTTILREMLARASSDVDASPPADPDVEAELRSTIGEMYSTLGLYPEAESHYARAVELNRKISGGESPALAVSLSKLALVLSNESRLEEAEAKQREVLVMRRRLFGERDAAVALAWNGLGEVLFVKGKRARARDEHERAWKECEESFRTAIALWSAIDRADATELARGKKNLALLLHARGDLDAARRLYEESLAALIAETGETSRATATLEFSIGTLLEKQGDLEGAESSLRRALATYERLLTDRHPATATALCSLAHVLNARKRFEEAAELYARALPARRQSSSDPIEIADALFGLGVAQAGAARHGEAQASFAEAAAIYAREEGQRHEWNGIALLRQGRALFDDGRFAEAATVLESASSILREKRGPQDAAARDALALLLRALESSGQSAHAAKLRAESAETR